MRLLNFNRLLAISFFVLGLQYQSEAQNGEGRFLSHAGIQYGGAIGFVNIQAGHTFFENESGDLDIMLGYVPTWVSAVDVWSLTLKYTHTFKELDFSIKKFQINPLGGGLYLSQGLGKNYFKYHNYDNYPFWYYGVANVPRVGVFYLLSANRELKNSARLSIYYELGTYDLRLFSLSNAGQTPKFLSVFNSSFGVKYRFKSEKEKSR